MIGRRGFIAGLLATAFAPKVAARGYANGGIIPPGTPHPVLDMSLLGESTTVPEYAIGPWASDIAQILPGRWVGPLHYVVSPGEVINDRPVSVWGPVLIEGSNGHA